MDLLEIQLSDDEEQIYAPLKRKWLKNTPEEAVRQEYIRCLGNDYGYTLDQMEQEYQSAIPGRGTGGAFADIVVWAKFNDKNNRKDALIVVECKAPSVTLSKKECGQLINYASDLNAKFLILTNRKETLFFKLKEGVRPAQIGDLIKINDIPNAQQAKQYSGKTFSFSVPIGLLPRDKEADNLFNCVIANRFFNLVGVGGSGKSSLASLMIQKHEEDFNEIAYVVVNNNIKNDFVEQINKTLRLEFEKDEDAFSELIDHLQNDFKSEHPNLLVLDINETSDKDKNDEIINSLIKNRDILDGWKILILSRENVDTRNRIATHNLNEKEDVEFLKELFLSKAGTRYNDFGDFAELFKTIFYNPLLAEQLGLYLNEDPELATIDDIKKILYGESFREEDMQGLSADRHDEPIVSFLTNLIKYNDLPDNEKNLLRHFVLWQAEYIGYDVIKDLLKGVFESDEDLKNALKSLSKRSILDTNKDKTLSYKLHGLLAESIREQIDIKKDNYDGYLINIKRIIKYDDYVFIPYADCIGNSLDKYDITTDYDLLNRVGNKLSDIRKIIAAKKIYEKYITKVESSSQNDPCNDDYQDDLAIGYNNLALLQQEHLKDYTTAEHYFKKTIKIREKLPIDNNDYLNRLIMTYNAFANLLDDCFHKHKKAESYYQKAIEISSTLPIDNPEYQNNLALLYYNLALLQSENYKDYSSAVSNLKKAIDIRVNLPQNNSEYQNDLTQSYIALGNTQKDGIKDINSAEKSYKNAIRIGERLPKSNPDYQKRVADAYHNLAILQADLLEDYESAKINISKAINIGQQIKSIYNDIFYVDWIDYKYTLAKIYFDNNEIESAQSILNDIQPQAEQCLADNPDDEETQNVNNEINDLLKLI